MGKTNTRYWLFQMLGWGGWSLLNLFFGFLFAQDNYFSSEERSRLFIAGIIIQFLWYVFFTHLLRLGLKRSGWMHYSSNKVIGLFLISVISAGTLSYFASRMTAIKTGNSLVKYEKINALKTARDKEILNGVKGTKYYLASPQNPSDSANYAVIKQIKKSTGWYRDAKGVWKYEDRRKARFWWDIIFNIILVSLWLLIYMVWHYLERNRRDVLDKLSLEKAVKDMELKTIKSHINPHFIFNSLNSIRALVDENPVRARQAITELSNILRSSLQVEKMETVPLEKELDIVKDFLALEQMRFEERLQVVLEIDPLTLHQPIPPMMLQTLVENAIKHGIGKQIEGGLVKIIARKTEETFELIVQNTGSLEEKTNVGFGFKSTRERLKILFNSQARLEVKEIEGDRVEAKVIMPLVD